jgi:UDP-N-acetylmuramyl pentapeptide synthase
MTKDRGVEQCQPRSQIARRICARCFLAFVARAETAVLNLDDAETALLAAKLPAKSLLTYGFADERADLWGSNVHEEPLAIGFDVTDRATGETLPVRLAVPGRHNAANALAALCAARACGVNLGRRFPRSPVLPAAPPFRCRGPGRTASP